MNEKVKIIAIASAALLTAAVSVIIPLTGPATGLFSDSISTLGSRDLPSGWIMNSSLVLLAVIMVITGWNFYAGSAFVRLFLVLFGVTLLLSVVFAEDLSCTGTLNKALNEGLHSYFLNTALLSFIALVFSTAALPRMEEKARIISVMTGMAVLLLILLIAEADEAKGAWQRLFFIIAPSWMISIIRS